MSVVFGCVLEVSDEDCAPKGQGFANPAKPYPLPDLERGERRETPGPHLTPLTQLVTGS
jgi:hypothetical protein